MAKPVSQIILGIDVAKDELVIAHWGTGTILAVPNNTKAIHAWLETLDGAVSLAIEPTSTYHLAVADTAQAMGFKVYLVNPRQLAHYREAVDVRHKSDPVDALLLARYLAHEQATLRLYAPRSPEAVELWALLKRRAVVVQSRKQLEQSFKGVGLSIQGLVTQFKTVLDRIDQRMLTLIDALGWSEDYQRCRSVPGIGPLNATALVAAYHRGAFAGTDAFVAFIGLDVRLRESGNYKGRRKLSKRGCSEMRRLLYCAARPARSHRPFDTYYQRQLEKGLSKTAANCILGRKLARLAFTLMTKRETFKKEANAYC